MGAALNTKTDRVEANVFELIELNEANESFIGFQFQNVLLLFVNLGGVLEDQLGIAQIVCYAWGVSNPLAGHACPSTHDIVLAFLEAHERFGKLRLQNTILVPARNVDSLEYFINLVCFLILFKMEPNVILRFATLDVDLWAAHDLFVEFVVSKTVGLHLVAFDGVEKDLILNVAISGMSMEGIICQF